MKFAAIAALLASASAAYAHTTVKAVFINGVDQGNGENTYIRSPPNNNPVKDLTSDFVACNVNSRAVSKTLEVSGGDVITFEYAHDNRGDDIMDPGHKGPVMVYVAPTSSNGQGAVWVKLHQEVYTNGQWASDKLIQNGGHVSITVPNLKAGEYLFRPEIVTLHEADTAYNVNSARGVQLYMECIQFKVVSSGSVSLPAGIDFKKSYTYADKGLVFNLYGSAATSYVAPGGTVSSIAGSNPGIGPVPAAGSKPTTQATTAKPTTAKPAATPTKMTTVTVKPTTSVSSGGSSSGTVAKYGQCGGNGYSGPTQCASGSTCKFNNDWYFQCL
ncbi:unnamed protein product [Rhizoctonia solani]|uniref:AA9 family lytic polysaccharide monooxygenase n=1 Tax=Rhizoctonia solani TaxID=456999 RepID=A0A8H3HF43_9AGAM|nr:unnamed protein product [Rhizoctonia solani]